MIYIYQQSQGPNRRQLKGKHQIIHKGGKQRKSSHSFLYNLLVTISHVKACNKDVSLSTLSENELSYSFLLAAVSQFMNLLTNHNVTWCLHSQHSLAGVAAATTTRAAAAAASPHHPPLRCATGVPQAAIGGLQGVQRRQCARKGG